MKRISALIVLALLCLVAAVPSSSAQTSSPRTADACESCHADFSSVLPKEHPAVKENVLAACLQCHSIGQAGEAKKNGFSTRIHLTHGGPKLHMECTACHTYVAGKSFGLIGQSNSWGRRKTAIWPRSSRSYILRQLPAIPTICTPATVDCAGCHGKKTASTLVPRRRNRPLPGFHGPLERLADKSAPKDFPERNPHRSHLGDEIPCALCHHAHAAATVYCLDCHRNFNMTIPGAGQ